MDLARMLDILQAKSPDYRKSHADIMESLNLPPTTLLTSYLTQIRNDTLLWFHSFPVHSVSFESLAKAKSALLYLLDKVSEVTQEVGAELCAEISSHVSSEWKKHGRRISEERKAAQGVADALSSSVSETESESTPSQVRALTAELATVKGKLELLKVIFMDTMREHSLEHEWKLLTRLLPSW